MENLIVPNGHGKRYVMPANTREWITADGDGSYTLWSYPNHPQLSESTSNSQPVILFNPEKKKTGLSHQELNNYSNTLILR